MGSSAKLPERVVTGEKNWPSAVRPPTVTSTDISLSRFEKHIPDTTRTSIGIDRTRHSRAVSVRDLKGAALLLRRLRLRRGELVLLAARGALARRARHPQIRRARVEIDDELLGGCADGDAACPLGVLVLVCQRDGACVALAARRGRSERLEAKALWQRAVAVGLQVAEHPLVLAGSRARRVNKESVEERWRLTCGSLCCS